MAKTVNTDLVWAGLHNTQDARVHVAVYDDVKFPGRSVVILTEPNDNPGTSVTNGIEMIVQQVVQEYNLNPYNLTIIEHYPPRQGRGIFGNETFDVVTFEDIGVGAMPRRPIWRRVSPATVADAIRTGADKEGNNDNGN